MATLTPDIARDLMYRSMTTGVPTNEFFQYGGYQAVKNAYERAGGGYSINEIPSSRKTELAKQVSETGIGNLAILAETRTPLTAAGLAHIASQGHDPKDIQTIIDRYLSFKNDDLVADNNSDLVGNDGGGGSNSGSNSGGLVNGGGNLDGGTTDQNSNATTGRPVYGPDGKMYSSVAAALAAGVTDYSFDRPSLGTNPGLIEGADTLSGAFMNPVANAPTGNVNPSGLIANQSEQLFSYGAPKINLPQPTTNPFATTNSGNPFAVDFVKNFGTNIFTK